MKDIIRKRLAAASQSISARYPLARPILDKLKPVAKRILNYRSCSTDGDIWGKRHLDDQYWEGAIHWGAIPAVAEYMNRSISGSSTIDFIGHSKKTRIEPLREKHTEIRMLSLCCGVGQLEMDLLKSGYADRIDGYDASAACVAEAQKRADREHLSDRISFYHVDLNSFSFPKDHTYNVVLNEAALHHIQNLEHIFSEIEKILVDDGCIISHDYIGPNQHQWTSVQLKHINRILASLPKELKHSRTNPFLVHDKKHALSLAEMNTIDPTEGIRASEILPVMEKYFTIVEYKNFGGTLLHPLFNDIAGNFMTPEYDSLVHDLIRQEEKLIADNVLQSDFAYWVATKK